MPLDPSGVTALLDAVTPADPTEAEHLAAMRALVRSDDCGSRHHYTPGHFTASAFVLDPDRSALLLIEHSKLHRWLQPGGHVDPTDPDLLSAARREVAEEVGLTDLEVCEPVPFDVDVHVIPARPAKPGRAAEPEHRHFDVRFLFQAKTRDVTAGSDALAARWVPLDAMHTVESDESVYRAVRKLTR